MISLWLLSKTISRNVYILRSCEEDWMGPGSWDFDIWRDRTTVLTFGIFGKYKNPPHFWKPTTQVLFRDLAMLRGLRMARIRPSRLRILNAGVKIRIGFTKKSNFQKMFEHVENLDFPPGGVGVMGGALLMTVAVRRSRYVHCMKSQFSALTPTSICWDYWQPQVGVILSDKTKPNGKDTSGL